jgi:Fe-S oxidoreductase
VSTVETLTPFAEIIQEIKEAGGEACRLCYQCGKCDVVCPWNRVRAFSIRKIMWQATLGVPDIELEDIWRCTSCGRCPSHCPRGVRQIEVGVAIRRLASAYDVFPEPVQGVKAATGGLLSAGNPMSKKREERDAWATGLGVKPYAEGMELLYFVGCYYSYDPRLQKVAVATADILNRAGVDFGILGSAESCCGESIRKAGNEEAFKALARQNIRAFIDGGVKKILVASPHCYHTFKNEYPEFMVSFEVVHIAQLLQQLIEEGRLALTGEVARRITYHDPCFLGRHNGIYDPPREVLRHVPGVELVEMSDSREDSLCCGGGGGRIWMETAREERFSDLRLEQAKEVGADVLVTSCPYCITNFEDSRFSMGGDEPLEVRDITEIIQESLDGAAKTT